MVPTSKDDDKGSGPGDKELARRRKLAAADLRQRAAKNLVFGIVAAVVGGALTVWSSRTGGNIGLSVTQLIYWCLVGGGALEAAAGCWQLYQAREVLEGRSEIPRDADVGATGTAERPAATGPFELTLRPARGRHLGWGLFALALAALFVFAFGGAGRFIGGLCLGWAAYHAFRLVSNAVRKPQSVRIEDDRLSLPLTPFSDPTELKPTEVRQAYFLRRSVPLFHAVPVLVVDLGDRALLFPRNWFASDSDQERMAAAIRSRLPSR